LHQLLSTEVKIWCGDVDVDVVEVQHFVHVAATWIMDRDFPRQMGWVERVHCGICYIAQWQICTWIFFNLGGSRGEYFSGMICHPLRGEGKYWSEQLLGFTFFTAGLLARAVQTMEEAIN
jgi:hypothetical protein